MKTFLLLRSSIFMTWMVNKIVVFLCVVVAWCFFAIVSISKLNCYSSEAWKLLFVSFDSIWNEKYEWKWSERQADWSINLSLFAIKISCFSYYLSSTQKINDNENVCEFILTINGLIECIFQWRRHFYTLERHYCVLMWYSDSRCSRKNKFIWKKYSD